ncbi:MAG: ferredoxin [Nitrospirota bacterium]|nr:MAG: ferredoxin [Nitrospirota bacterium]
MKALILYAECVGCEACADLQPEIIEMRDEKAWIIAEKELTEEECGALVTICPASAIECD